jgi:NAD-dependent dihydropyrimidine dehydrogenase PreA subunit
VKIQRVKKEANSLVEVKVDHSKCNGDSICVDVCPVAVFELQELSEYPGEKKSVVVENDACIVCRACEVQCPTQAITITE